MDLRLYLTLINDLTCPACSQGCEAVHLDGNFKLFTWSRLNREPWRSPYYDEFFSADTDISSWMEGLDLAVPPKHRVSCAVSYCHMRAPYRDKLQHLASGALPQHAGISFV